MFATKNMNDFVIVRADFKSFFDSVKSEYVYEKYILPSIIKREDKQLLEKYVENFKYCYAGLCLSNGMTEIVCKDFDIVLKARLSEYGVFFYERYVDDIGVSLLRLQKGCLSLMQSQKRFILEEIVLIRMLIACLI